MAQVEGFFDIDIDIDIDFERRMGAAEPGTGVGRLSRWRIGFAGG